MRIRRSRLLAWIGVAVLCVAGIALFLSGRAEKRCPMKGLLVDVGGHKLHLYCEGSGSPVVLLAAGGMDSLLQWDQVQPKLAPSLRVCSFDAPGFGWSEPAGNPGWRQTAIDLHAALLKTGTGGPYIMVGHSNGGLVAQAFLHLFRSEVVGAVFDDSVNPEETILFPKRFETSPMERRAGMLAVRLGLLQDMCKETAACPHCVRFVDTLAQLGARYVEYEGEVRYRDSYGDMPLVVLEHDPSVGLAGERDDAFEKAWVGWQKEFASRSTNAKLEIASGVGHEIQTVKPQLVIDAVQWVIDRASRRVALPSAPATRPIPATGRSRSKTQPGLLRSTGS